MGWLDFLFVPFLTKKPMATVLVKVIEPYRKISRDQARVIVMKAVADMGLNTMAQALVYAQGVLESGYSSPVFEKNWNAFGMKIPSSRKTTSIGTGTGAPSGESSNQAANKYAKYANLYDSAQDLVLRHNAFKINWAIDGASPEAYAAFCTRTKYFQAPASQYKGIVVSVFNQLKRSGTVGGIGGSVLGAIALILLFTTLK